jgi:hypothetical protein
VDTVEEVYKIFDVNLVVVSGGSALMLLDSASDASLSTLKIGSSGVKESSESYLSSRERWRGGMLVAVFGRGVRVGVRAVESAETMNTKEGGHSVNEDGGSAVV